MYHFHSPYKCVVNCMLTFKISYRSTCGSFLLVLRQHCSELDRFASFRQCLLRSKWPQGVVAPRELLHINWSFEPDIRLQSNCEVKSSAANSLQAKIIQSTQRIFNKGILISICWQGSCISLADFTFKSQWTYNYWVGG